MKRPVLIPARYDGNGKAVLKPRSVVGTADFGSTKTTSPDCFTLERDGVAIVALSSRSLAGARRMVRQAWFVEELSLIFSAGSPLWMSGRSYTLRGATPLEASAVDLNRQIDGVRGEDTKFAFAFLVAIDPVVH